MVDLKLIESVPLPKGEPSTASAIMPRVLCCISGNKASVYKNRLRVKKFKHSENGLLKLKKMYDKERSIALSVYTKLSKSGPILIKQTRPIIPKNVEGGLGFEGSI